MAKWYITIDENGFLEGVGNLPMGKNSIEIELDSEEIINNPFVHRYVNGEVVYDESKVLEEYKNKKVRQVDSEPEDGDLKELLETLLLFQTGLITEIEYEGEILEQKEFEKLVKKAHKNKQDRKAKKKAKKDKIKNAKSLKELKNIQEDEE